MSDEKKPWSAEMQAAMKVLERFYRTSKAEDKLDDCPLCAALNKCPKCCWLVITGNSCIIQPVVVPVPSLKSPASELIHDDVIDTSANLIRLRRQRARELKQWMKHYEEEE